MSTRTRLKLTPRRTKLLRKKLLVDPDTRRIAEACKMQPGDYVALVLDYMKHPEKEPEVKVLPDAELRRLGHSPPSFKDVANFILKLARRQKEHDPRQTAFEPKPSKVPKRGAVPAAGGKRASQKR